MSIEEAQKAKMELEEQIIRLIRTFEDKTQMTVGRIELMQLRSCDAHRQITCGVKTEVSL